MSQEPRMRDPKGRAVILEQERWEHILSGHPELGRYKQDIAQAVEAPSEILAGRADDEEWFYLAGGGPSRWLKVVVVFDLKEEGRIITAFGRRKKP